MEGPGDAPESTVKGPRRLACLLSRFVLSNWVLPKRSEGTDKEVRGEL